jgi:Kef-type K+ transport system membrane component KefB
MFLAGLELDLNNAIKNKNKSIVFGALTFLIPIFVGFPICYYFLKLDLTASLVVASMFSTHTLVAYPIASRMGVTKNEAVTIAVGGTIITDTAVLLLLAFITSAHKGELNYQYWIQMLISCVLFGVFIFLFVPYFAKKFLKYIEGEKASQFIFILAIVFLAAYISHLIGIEAIVGAFFAGLALNRLIPHKSDLMSKVEFVGNALFIPFFLISVGMLVNLKVFLLGQRAIVVAVTLTIVAIFVKWLAAFITQKIYKLSAPQRRIIWGLSNAHAAAIMAVAVTCYKLGIVDENILNGTILLILVTCLVASFITENASRQLALENIALSKNKIDERILISSTAEENYQWMLEMAIAIKDNINSNPIYPLAVIEDNDNAKEQIISDKKSIENILNNIKFPLDNSSIITRIDYNKVSAISRTVKEDNITDIIIGWTNKQKTTDLLFGSFIENLSESVWQNLYATQLSNTPVAIKNIYIVFPENAEFEYGFRHLVDKIFMLIATNKASFEIYASQSTLDFIEKEKLIQKDLISKGKYILFHDWSDITQVVYKNKPEDLLILVSARKGTISHQLELDKLPEKIAKLFPISNFIIAYPEQKKSKIEESLIQANDIDTTHINQNLKRFDRLRKKLKEVFKK